MVPAVEPLVTYDCPSRLELQQIFAGHISIEHDICLTLEVGWEAWLQCASTVVLWVTRHRDDHRGSRVKAPVQEAELG